MAEYPPISCTLCPKECKIPEGHAGECRIRIHLKGKLLAVVHSRPITLSTDPIEKKPLYHFLPGTEILSLACVGCNLHCLNCQNWEISQCNPEDQPAYRRFTPERVIDLARRFNLPSLALTYTEPFAWFEYSLHLCQAARKRGIRTVLVTAAYANRKPARKLFALTDAVNIDLKALDNAFYRRITSGTLKPVLDNLILAKEMGVWLEVTNLIIPTLNDKSSQIKQLCHWHYKNLGAGTPLHFSAFFPRHRLKHLPPTPAQTLKMARQIALDRGIDFVYIGNLRGSAGSHTICPSCKKEIIRRVGYRVEKINLKDGKCAYCGQIIPGRWQP